MILLTFYVFCRIRSMKDLEIKNLLELKQEDLNS